MLGKDKLTQDQRVRVEALTAAIDFGRGKQYHDPAEILRSAVEFESFIKAGLVGVYDLGQQSFTHMSGEKSNV